MTESKAKRWKDMNQQERVAHLEMRLEQLAAAQDVMQWAQVFIKGWLKKLTAPRKR